MNVRSAKQAVLRRIPRGLKDAGLAAAVTSRRVAPTLLVRGVARAARREVASDAALAEARAARPGPPQTPTRLWVAPANFAGQGWAWARAAERTPAVGARSMNVTGPIDFPTDYAVPPAVYRDVSWQREQREALRAYTHVLVEAERPVLGRLYGDVAGERAALEELGLEVGYVVHGSDARRPDLHRAVHPHSPFRDPSDPWTARLQRLTTRNHALLTTTDRPVFVSTPDMLDMLPRATWLPVVVDPDEWAVDPAEPGAVPLQRDRPVVVHAPSNGRLKGSELVDPLMQELHAAGLIEYRTLRGLDRAGMRAAYREADIVLDQFVLGLYGVAAAEAMAAGRVVVAYVGESVRRHVRDATGLEVPIVEATPDDVVDVMRGLLADRDAARDLASRGPEFARAVHDGTLSAQVLATFVTS